MARYARATIQRYLRDGDAATTATSKGRALEDLTCYVFARVPGVSVVAVDTRDAFKSQELDVLLHNERSSRGLTFLPDWVAVECKNWSGPVGPIHVCWFDRKLRDRGLTFGILVAAQGITGDPEELTCAHQIVAGSLREGRQIVVITREDIEALRVTDDLVELLKRRLCELIVWRTAFRG